MSTDYLLRRNGDQFEPDGITIECHAEFGSDTVTIKISDGDFHHVMSADDYAPLAGDSDALRAYVETQRANLGRPWIRSAITPPATAVLIGGQGHGHTIGTPNPPRPTFVVDEDGQRVTYRLAGHNGAHWCYVDTRPAASSTVLVHNRQPLTINHHHRDLQRDASWVTITGRGRGVLCELPNEILADPTAISAWFDERHPTGIDQ